MPTYDYRCEACDHEFEEFQSMTAKPLRKCPECGKPKLKRLIGTGAGVIFKGSGFYETDYRSEGYKKAQKEESDAAKPKPDDAKSGKSDSSATSKSDTSTAKSDSGSSSKPADSKPKKSKPKD